MWFDRILVLLFARVVLLGAALLCVVRAQAALDERVGVLSVHDLYLEPQFRYYETRRGGFAAGNSLISIRWARDEVISGVVTAGTDELLGRPTRYVPAQEAEFTLAEAFIEARSSLGDFRFGRVALPFGTESGRSEARLRLPRSMVVREGWIGLRDQGLAFNVENEGFSSEWAVHNGEGGPDLDNQSWFTARWSWTGPSGFGLGFSGTAGRTKPASTQDAARSRTAAEAGLDPDRSSKQRFGNVFVEWEGRPLALVAEATFGEVEQSATITRVRGGHMDLIYSWSPQIGVLARHDILDPSDRVKGDRQDETTVGLSWKGPYETSTIYLLGTRASVENPTLNAAQSRPRVRHEGMLIWRLTPLARGPR